MNIHLFCLLPEYSSNKKENCQKVDISFVARLSFLHYNHNSTKLANISMQNKDIQNKGLVSMIKQSVNLVINSSLQITFISIKRKV